MTRASLSFLPTEIKIAIIGMCAAQDELMIEQIGRLKELETNFAWYPDEHEKEIRTTYRPSVHSLSEVSREWCSLANSHRFPLLTVEQIDTPELRLSFGAKYGQFIKGVNLLLGYQESILTVMASLEMLPNHNHCRLPFRSEIERSLEDESEDSDIARSEGQARILGRLLKVLSTVTSLEFYTLEDLRYAAPTAPSCIKMKIWASTAEDLYGIASLTRSSYPNLTHLDIDTESSSEDHYETYDGATADELARWSLDKLSIRVFALRIWRYYAWMADHISFFGSTITRLHLNISEQVPIRGFQLGQFPVLKGLSLTVRTLAETYDTHLSVALEVTFASLHDTYDSVWVYLRAAVDKDVNTDPQRMMWARRSKVPYIPTPPLQLLARPALIAERAEDGAAQSREEVTSCVRRNISNLMASVDDMAKQATAIGDVVQLARIMEALERCENLLLTDTNRTGISDYLTAINNVAEQAATTYNLVHLTKLAEALQRCQYFRIEWDA